MPPSDDLPPSSLILCTRNRSTLLADTIQSVAEGDELPTELIVVDQSDRPQPPAPGRLEERRCRLRYLHTKQPGLSRANNAGVAAARNDLLVFTHDDVRVDRAWYGTLLRALTRDGSRGIVTGRVRVEAGGVQLTFKDLETPRIYRGHVNEDILLVLNMAIHRSALMAVGGFDERLGPGTAFPGAEDNDLGLRLLEAGYAIRYVPEAVVIHRAWRPTDEYLTLRWSYGVAQGAFYAKHCRLRDGYMAGRMYGDVARHLRRFPARLRWRDRAGLAHDLVYTSGLLYGAARWRLTYGTAIASVAHI